MATHSAFTIDFETGLELAQELSTRGASRGLVAKRDLERHYDLLRRELGRVGLSESEAALICDASAGKVWDLHRVHLFWAEVDDAMRRAGLDSRWRVDGEALVAKLRDLTPAQALAVVDAVERFWRQPEELPMSKRLRTVGLVHAGREARAA